MTDPSETQLIADVTRHIITQAAPQELPHFRAISEAYFINPNTVLERNRKSPKDKMLGYGLGEAVTFLTPIALAVVTKVLTDLGVQALKDAAKRLVKIVQPVEPDDKRRPPTLSQDQINQIRRVAVEKSRQLGLSEGSSAVLADAVVGCLSNSPA